MSENAAGSVLVLENEEDIRKMLCERFRFLGLDVECVEDCADALELLKRRSFAVAVVDLGMSPIDGKTCGGYIHTLYPRMSLVAYTGYSEVAEEANLLKDNGFVGRYLKTVDYDRMVEDVCRLAGVRA